MLFIFDVDNKDMVTSGILVLIKPLIDRLINYRMIVLFTRGIKVKENLQ
jgi:hypothetical protein